MPEVTYLLFLAGAISLPGTGLRRRVVLALGPMALAIAGLRVGGGQAAMQGASLDDFLAVTAGLTLLGMVVALSVAVESGRRGLALAPGIFGAAWCARTLVRDAGVGPAVIAASALAVLVALALVIGRLTDLRRWIVALDGPGLRAPGSVRIGPTVLLSAFTLTALLAPHLALVLGSAAAASWAAWFLGRPAGSRWPFVPVLFTVMLILIYGFVSTVAGPERLSMSGLDALPLSPAAELLVAAAVLASSWLASGLWPLHRLIVAPLLAPAAIIVLARLALPAAPMGVEHWRGLVAPLVMLGIWHAGATRRGPELAIGAALAAVASAAPAGAEAAGWLLPAALTLLVVGDELEGETAARAWGRRLACVAGGWGGLLALEAGLHGEVVYTVLAAAGAMLGIGGGSQAMTPSAPRIVVPSA